MQRLGDPLVRDLLLVEVRLHQLVVVVGAGLDQLGAGLVGLVAMLGRDSSYSNSVPSSSFQTSALFSIRSTTPLKLVLGADRELDRQRVGAEAVLHRLDRA